MVSPELLHETPPYRGRYAPALIRIDRCGEVWRERYTGIVDRCPGQLVDFPVTRSACRPVS